MTSLNLIAHIKKHAQLSTHQAWWILESISGQSKEQLIVQTAIDQNIFDKVNKAIKQITVDHKPLAYITGKTDFYDIEILCKPPTLIPRPETEFLVEWIITHYQTSEKLNILDIGTGTGCIALILAKHFPNSQVTAVDISDKALHLAKENATHNNVTNTTFIKSNVYEKLQGQTFDFIISNPPYIDPAKKQSLDQSVTGWEDHQALFAGNKGLSVAQTIINQSTSFLKQSSFPLKIVLEIDSDQTEDIKKLCTKENLSCTVLEDQFERKRFIIIKR